MNSRIYKYPLEMKDKQVLMLPPGCRILSVINQGGNMVLYALVDIENYKYAVNIYIVGTGNPVPPEIDEAAFVATVQQGQFVWHVFADKHNA